MKWLSVVTSLLWEQRVKSQCPAGDDTAFTVVQLQILRSNAKWLKIVTQSRVFFHRYTIRVAWKSLLVIWSLKTGTVGTTWKGRGRGDRRSGGCEWSSKEKTESMKLGVVGRMTRTCLGERWQEWNGPMKDVRFLTNRERCGFWAVKL